MEIEAWLQGLGLERYAPAFRDNEIDWEVLANLTSISGKLVLQRSATGANCWVPSPRSGPRRPPPQSQRQSPAHRLRPMPNAASSP